MDWTALQRECAAIGKLDSLGTLPFQYPKCLGDEAFSGKSGGAVFSLLPEDAKPLTFDEGTWEQKIKSIHDSFATSRRVVSYKDIANELWVCDFKKKISPASAFYKAFMETMDKGIEVSWIHGDFSGHNLRTASGAIWIMDWEEMTELGPTLTDEVCYNLSGFHYTFGWSMRRVWTTFKQKYLDAPSRVTAIQAIAFLYGRGISMGKEIVECWEKL
jgi:hypothetical protein